jgi:hypothetical protein
MTDSPALGEQDPRKKTAAQSETNRLILTTMCKIPFVLQVLGRIFLSKNKIIAKYTLKFKVLRGTGGWNHGEREEAGMRIPGPCVRAPEVTTERGSHPVQPPRSTIR